MLQVPLDHRALLGIGGLAKRLEGRPDDAAARKPALLTCGVVRQLPARIEFAAVFDGEAVAQDAAFHTACAAGADDRVLDVGCGAGASARHTAGRAGHVIGVDVSAPLIKHALTRAREAGLDNVDFVVADAASHPFPDGSFDLCQSRFGTMFFDDPPRAFANLARALRAGGRLVMLVWREQERNEWATAVQAALGVPEEPSTVGPGPFSLAEPTALTELLHGAGFVGVDLRSLDDPVDYGPDAEIALRFLLALTEPRRADLAPPQRAIAERRLATLVREHFTPDGVLFGASAWLVTAER
jgi:SAM-dependent methyltransferase